MSLYTAFSRRLDVDTHFTLQLLVFDSTSNNATVKFRAAVYKGRCHKPFCGTATTPPIAAPQSRHVRRRYQPISPLFVTPVAAVCSSGTSGRWPRCCTTRHAAPHVCLCCSTAFTTPSTVWIWTLLPAGVSSLRVDTSTFSVEYRVFMKSLVTDITVLDARKPIWWPPLQEKGIDPYIYNLQRKSNKMQQCINIF